jgi:predicted nucleotide-binding protein
MNPKALVVEDDRPFARTVLQALLKHGFEVVYCDRPSRVAIELARQSFAVAIIDLIFPSAASGLDVLREVRRRSPEAIVFLMTVKNSCVTETVADAMRGGATYFFDKNDPEFIDRLMNEIERSLIEKRRRVFVSHGHNKLALLQLKDFLRSRLRHQPVVLAEQPSKGLTVVEKLEKVSAECSFAIVLLTKDDTQADGGIRARQNVIHEVGFFQGKYGRQNVLLVCEKGVEIFSNISGIVMIQFDTGHLEGTFESIRLELEAAGLIPGAE